jgi:small-conductance mechanosensitive channel
LEAIIPNDTLITHTVVNQSYTDTRVCQVVSVQVGYDCDLELALKILVDVATAQARVLPEPAPKAFVVRFADSGIDLELGFWVDDPEEGTKGLRSNMHVQIWREFKHHGISIPYPQRVVRVFTDGTPQGIAPGSGKIK